MTKESKNPKAHPVFYVYRHIRNDTGTPFYVGLGKHRPNANCPSLQYTRANAKGNDRSKHWNSIVNKAGGFTVEIILDNLTKEEALSKEIEFIALYGRTKDGGLLCNHTPGGEGVCEISPPRELRDRYREAYSNTIEDIEKNVFPEPNTGCSIWAGGIDGRGRPILHFRHKNHQVRRFLYQYYNKVELSKDEYVINTCNNALCVCPEHCVIGDIKDVQERKKVRGTIRRGENSHNAKLSESIVREMKELKASQNITSVEIARRYDFPLSTVKQMLNGKTWKHVIV